MNYKEKLEKYLTRVKNKTPEDNDRSMMSKTEDSLMYSYTDKSLSQSSVNYSFLEEKHKLKEKEKIALTESLGMQINNYKRTVQSCLNTESAQYTNTVRGIFLFITLASFQNYNLKNFLPGGDFNSTRILKKYEHLLPTDEMGRKFENKKELFTYCDKYGVNKNKNNRESISPPQKDFNGDSSFNPPMKIEELFNSKKN